MTHFTEATRQVARNPYRCMWCWQAINAGEAYMRYRFYRQGEAGTVKAHPECFDAIQEYASEEGGECEWTPGMERPARSATA